MQGIHHVTAISGEPADTVRLYGDVLGLRLVKRTVNFDDPGTWHLYFGDRTGTPGSAITFFPVVNGYRGRVGTGQVAVTSFAIPPESLGYWMERLGARGVAFEHPVTRFDERVLALRDRDGMPLELVATPRVAATPGWEGQAGVPAEHAVRGFHGVTIWSDGPAPGTESILTGHLGFREASEADGTRRFVTDAAIGGVVDVRRTDGFWRGSGGVGTVHHVAFRAADDAAQRLVRDALLRDGVQVTTVQERQYFRSIYFREPGGVLFEVATDSPGFLVDETDAALGSELKLPPWLEAQRAQIARVLPPLHPALAGAEGA
ncbi:MAG TPA: ring-cleaving dioxygenase [Gemmatimonadales bacterium]|nr:ring-cleaving dioxygenase [Gemmatimonadales bacterium]